VHSRRILGWRVARTMRTALVLDALEMALWTRHRDGITDLSGLIHHHDNGSQGVNGQRDFPAGGQLFSLRADS